MAKTTRFQSALEQILDTKEDKTIFYGGLLGTFDSTGTEIIDVPERTNFSFVRLNGSMNEVIEAYNVTVSTALDNFGLKVRVAKRPGEFFYEIVGIDLSQYTDFGNGGTSAFLPLHAQTHTFGSGEGVGTDPVFIYKRQILQPMGVRPQFTGTSFTAYVEPDFYIWNNQIEYFEGASTVDLSPLKPTDTQLRYVTIYLDGSTNSIKYKTGTLFTSVTSLTDLISNVPEVSVSEGLQLAAVYLTSGTTSVNWDNLFDIRNFLNAGGTSAVGLPTGIPNGDVLYGSNGSFGYNNAFNWISGLLTVGAVKIGTGTAFTQIERAATQVGTITYKLPILQGAASSYLKNDGSGNLSWGVITGTSGGSLSGIPTGAVVFGNTDGTATWSDQYFHWMDTTKQLLIGTNTLPFGSGSKIFIQHTGTFASFSLVGFGAGGGSLIGRAVGGTVASPTAVIGGRHLLDLDSSGYDGAGYTSAAARVAGVTTYDWNSSDHAAHLAFSATPTGSTTLTLITRFYGDYSEFYSPVYVDKLRFGTGSIYTEFVKAGSQAAIINYIWPDTQGGPLTFLRNDGSGNLSWVTITGASSGSGGNEYLTGVPQGAILFGSPTGVATWNSSVLTWDNVNKLLFVNSGHINVIQDDTSGANAVSVSLTNSNSTTPAAGSFENQYFGSPDSVTTKYGIIATSVGTGLRNIAGYFAAQNGGTGSYSLYTYLGTNVFSRISVSYPPYHNGSQVFMAVMGSGSSFAYGPHMHFYTIDNNFPLLQILPYAHDNVNLGFDAYYDGENWRSSFGSNFAIRKTNDKLIFSSATGTASGGLITWKDNLEFTKQKIRFLGTAIDIDNGNVVLNTGSITLNYKTLVINQRDTTTPFGIYVGVFAAQAQSTAGFFTNSANMTGTIKYGIEAGAGQPASKNIGGFFSATGGDIDNISIVGIGDSSVISHQIYNWYAPHHNGGQAALNIIGSGTSFAYGPNINFYIPTQNQPIMQILPYAVDNQVMAWDAYWDGSNWLSSSSNSNFIFQKTANRINWYLSTGVAPGDGAGITVFMVFDNLGHIGIGPGFTAPLTQLHVIENSTASVRGVTFEQNSASADGSLLSLKKSRGTFGSPSAVSQGDILSNISTLGHNGTSYFSAVLLRGVATETWGGTIGADWEVLVIPSGTSSTVKMLNIGGDYGIKAYHVSGGLSGTPTITGGAGAGGSNTCTIVGNDLSGELTINSGSSPVTGSVVATITFNKTYAGTPYVVIMSSNANSTALSARFYIRSTAPGNFVIGTAATAPTANTTFKFMYHVFY